MGRTAKPTRLKVQDGVRPYRINGSEPQSPDGLGEPPEWFDDVMLAAWNRMVERLGEMKLGQNADAELVAIYCQNYAIWRQASDDVKPFRKQDGTVVSRLTVASDTGVEKANPAFSILHEAQRTMVRILGQLGMNPAARATMHVAPVDEEDAVEKAMQKAQDIRANGSRRAKKAT